MIKTRAALSTSGLLLVLGGGCSDGRTAGNSTQTENTASARVIAVDSILPVGIGRTRPNTIATLRLDAANFDFSNSDPTGQDLEVVKGNGSPVPFEVVFWDKSAALGRLHVRLDSALLSGGMSFELRWNRTLAQRADSAAVWAGITDSQRLEVNSVLVDRFERGSLTSLLPDSASWFTGTSDSGRITAFGLSSAPSNRTGTVLHLSYNARLLTGQYVYASLKLANTPRVFRSLDSLVFWVRGTGNFSPALEHMVPGQSTRKAWKQLVIDTASGWQRIKIGPDDFDSASTVNGSVGWLSIRDTIDHLTFLVGGVGDLWIDDIRIYGLDPSDLR